MKEEKHRREAVLLLSRILSFRVNCRIFPGTLTIHQETIRHRMRVGIMDNAYALYFSAI